MKRVRIRIPEIQRMQRMVSRARSFGAKIVMQFKFSDVVKRDGLVCYLCNVELTREAATIDHVMPLSRGGFHCLSNVKICCRKCNAQKQNMTLEEYQEFLKMPRSKNCKNCGKEFSVRPHTLNKSFYCSRDCHYKGRSKK